MIMDRQQRHPLWSGYVLLNDPVSAKLQDYKGRCDLGTEGHCAGDLPYHPDLPQLSLQFPVNGSRRDNCEDQAGYRSIPSESPYGETYFTVFPVVTNLCAVRPVLVNVLSV